MVEITKDLIFDIADPLGLGSRASELLGTIEVALAWQKAFGTHDEPDRIKLDQENTDLLIELLRVGATLPQHAAEQIVGRVIERIQQDSEGEARLPHVENLTLALEGVLAYGR